MTQLYLHERHAKRLAPAEMRDVCEMHARKHGGHGDLVWCGPPVNCWEVRMTLRPGDPRLKSDHPEDHYEGFLLHEWVDPVEEPLHPRRQYLRRNSQGEPVASFVPTELEELGAEGLKHILEKTDILSGRGEIANPNDAINATIARGRKQSEKRKAAQKAQAIDRTKDLRRQILKIPFLPVGIALNKGSDK